MKTNYSLIFYIRRQRNYQSGPVPIYLRITVDGQRAELTKGRDCLPEEWNGGLGRAIDKKEKCKALDAYLDTLQQKVKMAHHELLDGGKPISSKNICDQFSDRGDKPKLLLELL